MATTISVTTASPIFKNTAGTQGQSGWDIEAEWGPDGALCVGDPVVVRQGRRGGNAH